MARVLDAFRKAAAYDEATFAADAPRLTASGFSLRTVAQVFGTGVCYYLATQLAWLLCFPDSKVSLFFPPHAVLVAILLLVPSRQWWAYVLAAACSHYFATQRAHWPPFYAFECELFDAVQNLSTAAGIRFFIKSPFHRITLREAVAFVVIAVVVGPFGTAFWGAAFTVSNHFGTNYWVEWRNLGISNGVTAIVLVPAILIGVHHLRMLVSTGFKASRTRILEAGVLALGILAVGYIGFNRVPAGPDSSPALLYAPIPVLIWAALRFGVGGMSASMLAITILAIWGTMQGRGPFPTQSPVQSAVALQMFLLMAATPLVLLAVAMDDERRSREALRVNEDRMNLAVESAQLALWDWDAANDGFWITDEGRRFYDFAPGEPLHYTSLAGRVHPDDRAVRAAAIQSALETHGAFEVEFRVILPDGSVRWIASRGRRASTAADGAPPRILGVSMDITRQKQATIDAQLQREELAHLARVATMNALSGSLAHELSQPVLGILNNARAGQILIDRNVPDIAEVRAIFEDILGAAGRAGEIIESLRRMLRRGVVAQQPVSVSDSLDELLRLIRSDLIERGVSVATVIPGNLEPAMTDRVHLQQVVLNLIMNACDAMAANPPGERNLTLTACVAQKEIQIGVLDSGVGLPADVEALFQPFHTTKDGGLGMGLSICRMLVTSHGGRLWAESRAKRGAAFYVALPRTNETGIRFPRPDEQSVHYDEGRLHQPASR